MVALGCVLGQVHFYMKIQHCACLQAILTSRTARLVSPQVDTP